MLQNGKYVRTDTDQCPICGWDQEECDGHTLQDFALQPAEPPAVDDTWKGPELAELLIELYNRHPEDAEYMERVEKVIRSASFSVHRFCYQDILFDVALLTDGSILALPEGMPALLPLAK